MAAACAPHSNVSSPPWRPPPMSHTEPTKLSQQSPKPRQPLSQKQNAGCSGVPTPTAPPHVSKVHCSLVGGGGGVGSVGAGVGEAVGAAVGARVNGRGSGGVDAAAACSDSVSSTSAGNGPGASTGSGVAGVAGCVPGGGHAPFSASISPSVEPWASVIRASEGAIFRTSDIYRAGNLPASAQPSARSPPSIR